MANKKSNFPAGKAAKLSPISDMLTGAPKSKTGAPNNKQAAKGKKFGFAGFGK